MSKVTTKSELRLSYTNLLIPRMQDEAKPDVLTYSTAILIPKTEVALIKELRAAIKEALAEGVAKKWGGKTPANLKNPLRDGDSERPDDEVYKDHFFINAKGPRGGKEQPVLLTSKGVQTDSAEVIYSGVFARLSVQFYPFDVSGNKGVAAGVTSVLSMEHGEPLGNTVTAESARNEFGITTPAGDAAAEFKSAVAKSASEVEPTDDDDDPWAS